MPRPHTPRRKISYLQLHRQVIQRLSPRWRRHRVCRFGYGEITASAIRLNQLDPPVVIALQRPARHGDVAAMIKEMGLVERIKDPLDQYGFLLDNGEFFCRKGAAWVAWVTGQIDKLPTSIDGLYSEDLW